MCASYIGPRVASVAQLAAGMRLTWGFFSSHDGERLEDVESLNPCWVAAATRLKR